MTAKVYHRNYEPPTVLPRLQTMPPGLELCAYYEAEAARCAQDLLPRNVAMADYLNGKNLLST